MRRRDPSRGLIGSGAVSREVGSAPMPNARLSELTHPQCGSPLVRHDRLEWARRSVWVGGCTYRTQPCDGRLCAQRAARLVGLCSSHMEISARTARSGGRGTPGAPRPEVHRGCDARRRGLGRPRGNARPCDRITRQRDRLRRLGDGAVAPVPALAWTQKARRRRGSPESGASRRRRSNACRRGARGDHSCRSCSRCRVRVVVGRPGGRTRYRCCPRN